MDTYLSCDLFKVSFYFEIHLYLVFVGYSPNLGRSKST